MTTSIRKFMAGNSEEALTFGMEDFTDGEQKLDVHVSPEASVDEVVGEMAEAEVKQREIARDCDTAMQAKTALEGYVDLMEKSLDTGGISGDVYEPIRMGLESYGESLGLEESENLPARNDFGGSSSRQSATKAAIGKGSGMIKKAWEVLKRILNALANAIKDVMAKASFAARRLEKRCGELAAQTNRMTGSVLESGKEVIELKGTDKLFSDGRFMGADFKTMAGFARSVSGGLTDASIKYMSEVASRIRGIDPSKELTDEQAAVSLGLIDIVKQQAAMTKVNDQRFPKDAEVFRAAVLPGSKALYMSAPQGNSKKQRVERLNTLFRLELMSIPNAKKPSDKEQINVKSLQVLRAQLTEAAKIANMIAKSDSKVSAFENAVKQLKEAGDALQAKAEKAEMSSNTSQNVRILLNSVAAIQKSKSGISGGLAHTVTTVNAMVSLIERQMAQYSAARLPGSTSTPNAPATT